MLKTNTYKFLVLPEYILSAMIEQGIDVTKLVNDIALHHNDKWDDESDGHKLIKEWNEKLMVALGRHTLHEIYAFNTNAPGTLRVFIDHSMIHALTMNTGYNMDMRNKEIYNNLLSNDKNIKFKDTFDVLVGTNVGVVVLKEGFNYLIDNELEFTSSLIGVIETIKGADIIYKDIDVCCEYIRLINKK